MHVAPEEGGDWGMSFSVMERFFANVRSITSAPPTKKKVVMSWPCDEEEEEEEVQTSSEDSLWGSLRARRWRISDAWAGLLP